VQPLPYTDAGAKVVFYALVIAWGVGELRTRVRTRDNQSGTSPEWGSFIAVGVTVGAGFIGGFLCATKVEAAAIEFDRWPLFIIGAILAAAGIAFRQWAIAVLGAYFTVQVRVSDDQPVVEAGPYRHLAHPSYTGILVTFVGIGLMLGNWLSLACLVLLPTVGLVIRIKVEERALLAGIGEPYRRFLAGRARLFPGIW
jgi:protein-S-isoprenylcysteine O-methyltransferase Ste14